MAFGADTIRRVSAAIFFVVALFGGELEAQQTTPNMDLGTRSARLAQRVMSPFCPGKSLYDCPSGSATEMRLEMTTWLEDGLSEEEVVGRLEAKMPGFDFTPPPATSKLFWVSWAFATLLLVLAIIRLVRRGPREETLSKTEVSEDESDDDEYERRLDDALRRAKQ